MKQLSTFKTQVNNFAHAVTTFENTVTFFTHFNIENENKEVKVTVKFDGFGGHTTFTQFNKDGHRSQDLMTARQLSNKLVNSLLTKAS